MATEGAFEAARRLFAAALERPTAERPAFLEAACEGDGALLAEVQALLAAEADADPRLERPALASLVGAAQLDANRPDRIGPFHVLGVLGSGGMGVVYEAEQDQPRRRVALKVLRSPFVSEDDLRRFELEGRALAFLNHPGIATVFATGMAGTGAEARPYLAMELVRGERIDTFAARADLDVPQRIELVARLCDAVHHAHLRGVLHRDLKPANVLVDEAGQPKVLDFGVARIPSEEVDASTRLTSAGEILGTLAYMSPEQLSGDPARIDVRTDVYALGLIAYELLARRRAIELPAGEVSGALQALAGLEPTRLGLLEKRLRGDVETVVHTALAKEPERRYGSAAELASDLRRILANEPIAARPASRSYQLRKFARRNRAVVSGLSAAFLALLVGAVTSTILYLEKEEQRTAALERGQELEHALELARDNLVRALGAEQEALDEAETAGAVTEYLVSMFEVANPEAYGLQSNASDPADEDGKRWSWTAVELLDEGVARLQGRFEEQPLVRGHLLNTLGKIYVRLQDYRRARPLLEEALLLTAQVHGKDSAAYSVPLMLLAITDLARGERETADQRLRQAVALRREHLGAEHPDVAAAQEYLAVSLRLRSRYEEAAAVFQEALRILELHGDPRLRIRLEYSLAALCLETGRYDEAERGLRRVLAEQERLFGTDHWRPLQTRLALAIALSDYAPIGSPRALEALELVRGARAGLIEIFGEDSAPALVSTNLLANTLRIAGDSEAAEALYVDVLLQATEAGDEVSVARTLLPLARTIHDEGRLDEAEGIYREVIEKLDGTDLLQDDSLPAARHNLAQILLETGRLEEAERLEAASLEQRLEALGPDHIATRTSRENLEEIRRQLGAQDG